MNSALDLKQIEQKEVTEMSIDYALTQLPDRPAPHFGTLQRRWTVLDKDGKGWLISYANLPECMAFKFADGKVVSYADEYRNCFDDPDDALNDILEQMETEDGIRVKRPLPSVIAARGADHFGEQNG